MLNVNEKEIFEMSKKIVKKTKCAICGIEFEGFGCNPDPVRRGENDRCCPQCDYIFVIPARSRQFEYLDFLEKMGTI